MKKETFLIIFSYLTVYIVWGSTYFFIKMSVESIPPFYVVGCRFFIGGFLILLFSFLTGRLKPFPTGREILHSIFLGSLLLLGANGLITIAERKVDSYLVALILASTPIAVAFFDKILLKKDIPLIRLVGILLGLAGVALLLYNGDSLTTSFSPEIMMVICGMGLWSLATSLGHKIKVYKDTLVNSGIQMLFVGIVSLIGVSFIEPPLFSLIPSFTLRSLLGLSYLAVIGSLAFCAYTYLIGHEPAIRVTSYALINPGIAVILGLILGDETPAPFLVLGFPLILAGLFLMLYGEVVLNRLRRNKKIKHQAV